MKKPPCCSTDNLFDPKRTKHRHHFVETNPLKQPLLPTQTITDAPDKAGDIIADDANKQPLLAKQTITDVPDKAGDIIADDANQPTTAAASSIPQTKESSSSSPHDKTVMDASEEGDLEANIEGSQPLINANDPTSHTSADKTMEEADIWTKLTLPTELFKSGLDSYIFLLPTVTNLSRLKQPTLAIQLGVGLFSAGVGSGTAFCHYVVNYFHQSMDMDTQAKRTVSTVGFILIAAALVFDGLGHGFEGTAMTNGAFSQKPLPYAQELEMNSGLLIASMLMSWSDIRTCITLIARLFDIQCPEPTQYEALIAPKVALIGRVYCVFFANLIFYSQLIDRYTGWDTTKTQMGISQNSLYLAGAWALFLTAGAGYCQYLLNVASLKPKQTSVSPPIATTLHPLQSTALGFSWVVGAGELAASIDFIINKKITNPWSSICVSAIALAAGAVTSYPTQRTYRKTLLEFNAITRLQTTALTASSVA